MYEKDKSNAVNLKASYITSFYIDEAT